MVSGASLNDLYRTVISLQSHRTYFFGIGSCEKCLHPLALPPAHKNRLRAAFPFAHSGRKGLNTILVKFVHARKNYPPSLLGISFASGWRGKSKSDNNAIRSRARRAKKAHQGVVYASGRRSARRSNPADSEQDPGA